jgi:hypothetical protein
MKKWWATACPCPLPPLAGCAKAARSTADRPRRLVTLHLRQAGFIADDAGLPQRRPGGRSLQSRRSVKLAHRSVGAATRSGWFRLAYASAPESRLLDGTAYGAAPVRWLATLRAPSRRARGARRDGKEMEASRGSGIETSAFILMTGRFPGTREVGSEDTSTRLCCGVSSSHAGGPRAHRYHHCLLL